MELDHGQERINWISTHSNNIEEIKCKYGGKYDDE